jgi:flavin-dependent dehydrogenase
MGFKVILFEAKTYPHHKVCGEFLSPECAYILSELGVKRALLACQPASIHTVCITAPDGDSWETRLPSPALSISRYVLDSNLADHAKRIGVEVCEGTTVTDVSGSLDVGFSLEVRSTSGQTRFSAKTVVAAYGKRSNLDGVLNRSFLREPQPFIGLKSHFYGPPLPGRIELHGFKGGYCGLSEVEDGKVNVCLLVRQNEFREANTRSGSSNDNITAFIEWMQCQNPQLHHWLSQASQVNNQWLCIAQVPFNHKQVVEQDILMVGDAAGLIAPLAGSGMGMALQGGKLAAHYMALFLSGQLLAAEVRSMYPAEWRREFGTRLRLGRLLQTFMLHPPLLSFGLRLTNTLPSLGNYLLTHTRDMRLIEHRGELQ